MRLTDSIRAKLATGIVQRAYDTHSMLFWGGVAAMDLCRGCDEPVAGDVAVGYRSLSGELHWFHLMCDELRKGMNNRDTMT
jgi:hypothetical protein